MAKHGHAKLTDLLQTHADCPKARPVSVHDRRKARYRAQLPLSILPAEAAPPY
jgi:hypothetical protein